MAWTFLSKRCCTGRRVRATLRGLDFSPSVAQARKGVPVLCRPCSSVSRADAVHSNPNISTAII
ncbi:MAG: hypothetical protein ACK4UU_09110, partial [Fimbriimonadales bacterium]